MRFITAGTLGGVIYLQTLLVNGQPILVTTDGYSFPSESSIDHHDYQNSFQDRNGQSTFHRRPTVIAPSSVVFNHSEKVPAQKRSDPLNEEVMLQRRSPSLGRIDRKELHALSAATDGGAPSWLHVDGSGRRHDINEKSELLVKRHGGIGTGVFTPKYASEPHSNVSKENKPSPSGKEWTKVKASENPSVSQTQAEVEARQNVENLSARLGRVVSRGPTALLGKEWDPVYEKRGMTKGEEPVKESLLEKRNDPKDSKQKASTGVFHPQYHLTKKAETKSVESSSTVDDITKRLGTNLSFDKSKSEAKGLLKPWSVTQVNANEWKPWNKRQNADYDPALQLVRRGIAVADGIREQMALTKRMEGERPRAQQRRASRLRRGTVVSTTSTMAPSAAYPVPISTMMPMHLVPQHQTPPFGQPRHMQAVGGQPIVLYRAPFPVSHFPASANTYGQNNVANMVSTPPVQYSSQHSLQRTPLLQQQQQQQQQQQRMATQTSQSQPRQVTRLPSQEQVEGAIAAAGSGQLFNKPLSEVFAPPGGSLFFTD